MIRRALPLLLLALCCLQLGCDDHGDAWVVRHADRDGNLDKLKDPEGIVRAQALANRLRNEKISAIFSTDRVRTRGTAQPLADSLGLEIITYLTESEVAGEVKRNYRGKKVLIVGHSNTVPEIIKAFGAKVPEALPLNEWGHIHELDFDNLELVRFGPGGRAAAVHSTYGAETPPP